MAAQFSASCRKRPGPVFLQSQNDPHRRLPRRPDEPDLLLIQEICHAVTGPSHARWERQMDVIALEDLLPPNTPLSLFDDLDEWHLLNDLKDNGMIDPPLVTQADHRWVFHRRRAALLRLAVAGPQT